MQIGNYLFKCQFKSAAVLPEFKGSTLRGGLGHALKKIACALGRQQCETCLLAGHCAYAVIFETQKPLPAADQPRIAARPHPYVLQPPIDRRRQYQAGDDFSFGLLLFGRANDYLPHLIYAVDRLCENGLGHNGHQQRAGLTLAAVSAVGTAIYDGQSKTLAPAAAVARHELTAPPAEPPGSLAVDLLTPLRLKHQNNFQDQLPFHLLIRAALRRISSLEAAFGAGEPELDYRGLSKRAAMVKTTGCQWSWQELERYSSRQKTGMLIGGLTGRAAYQGDDLGEFLPLLRYCEKTHLGKQTAFGLGRIKVEAKKIFCGT